MKIKLMIRKELHCNCSFQYSIFRVQRVFCRKEVDNTLPSSNIWRRERSYAASVASDIREPHKDRKRVPKEDRRVLIESFVDKYRAINAGRFPSISLTKKQVGGSFYVVRNILQELQSKPTIPSLKRRFEKSIQADAANDINHADNKQLEAEPQMSSCAKETFAGDVNLATLVNHTIVQTGRNLQEKEAEEVSSTSRGEPAVDCRDDRDSSPFVYAESHMLKNEREVVSDTCAQRIKHEDSPKCEDDQVHSSRELNREKIDQKTAKDAEASSNLKPWGRIKSIVDSVINIWRNR